MGPWTHPWPQRRPLRGVRATGFQDWQCVVLHCIGRGALGDHGDLGDLLGSKVVNLGGLGNPTADKVGNAMSCVALRVAQNSHARAGHTVYYSLLLSTSIVVVRFVSTHACVGVV